MTAQSAATTAADIVEGLIQTERFITRNEPWARMFMDMAVEAALGDGIARGHVPNPPARMSDVKQRQVVYTAQDAATRRVWQQHRIVHDIDPELWEELGEIDEDTRLPAAVLDQLPYPDPFLVWPRLPRVAIEGGKYMRAVGAFVTGRSRVAIGDPDVLSGPGVSLGWPVSTHSPHASKGLVLTIIHIVEHPDGRVVRIPFMDNIVDSMLSRVTLILAADTDVTVRELADSIAERYDDGIDTGISQTGTGFNDVVRSTLRRIIAVLLYLCATNADLRQLPAPATLRVVKGTALAAKPPKVIRTGYVVGAGLRAWKRRAASDTPAPGAGHRPVRPHVRRAHPHLYWTGEGRKTPRIKWLFPVLVNAHLDTTLTTVQPVRRREKIS